MRIFFASICCFMVLSTSAQALTLVCSMIGANFVGPNSIGGGYNQKILDSYIPRKQTHVIDLKKNTAFYKNFEFKTNLQNVDDKIIKWTYNAKNRNSKGGPSQAISLKFIYFRGTHSISHTVEPRGLIRKMTVRNASCVEK